MTNNPIYNEVSLHIVRDDEHLINAYANLRRIYEKAKEEEREHGKSPSNKGYFSYLDESGFRKRQKIRCINGCDYEMLVCEVTVVPLVRVKDPNTFLRIGNMQIEFTCPLCFRPQGAHIMPFTMFLGD